MSPSLRTLVADRGDAGVRLDLVLRRHLTDVSAATRTRVQAWIEGGQVTVNGAPVRRVAARAALGDLVSVVLPDPKPRRVMAAEDVALDVLYEDDHLLALNKPAGLVVHPAYKHPAGTLMNALLWRARTWPDGGRPSIVGRLDKLTSGIVLVAKTAEVHAKLQRAARANAAKDYLAVVYGRVNVARGEIDLRLHRDERDRRRVVASTSIGARSVTEFERLARVPAPRAGLALLRCRLITGRRHQIRVHLAARGWPIVGDPVYGDALALSDGRSSLRCRATGVEGLALSGVEGLALSGVEGRWPAVDDPMLASALRAFSRQALHSWRLALVHPITGEPLRIEAPIPQDIADLIATAGLDARATS